MTAENPRGRRGAALAHLLTGCGLRTRRVYGHANRWSRMLGLSLGGAALLSTMAASASYIAVPEANPSLSLAASLGVTFPFNILVGIPLYHALARLLYPAGS